MSSLAATDLQSLRRKLLTVAYESGEPTHLASSLSVLDIIWTLYDKVMGSDDVFILSKGHAALALYVVLNAKGIISDKLLATFGKPGSTLYGHPCIGTPGVYCTTGSLGHGCAVSVGAAYAKRLKGETGRVFCLLGDGEMNEGSCYEAAILANRFNLRNLKWIIDYNATDPNEVDLMDVLGSFGFDVWQRLGDGSSSTTLTRLKPNALIWRTTKGHGIPAMEADPQAWHRAKMSPEQYAEFMAL